MDTTHLYRYEVTVNHDGGKITITTMAHTIQHAKNNVVASEGCPETAITNVKEVKQYY